MIPVILQILIKMESGKGCLFFKAIEIPYMPAGGHTLLIRVNGKKYDMKVTKVSWDDDYPDRVFIHVESSRFCGNDFSQDENWIPEQHSQESKIPYELRQCSI